MAEEQDKISDNISDNIFNTIAKNMDSCFVATPSAIAYGVHSLTVAYGFGSHQIFY